MIPPPRSSRRQASANTTMQNFMPELMSYLRNVLPADALSMVERFLTQVAEGSGVNIL